MFQINTPNVVTKWVVGLWMLTGFVLDFFLYFGLLISYKKNKFKKHRYEK